MTALAFLLLAAAASMIRSIATSSDSFNGRMVGTFAINIGGAFLLGLLSGSGSSSQLLLGTAGLGALTTFSTFISQVECIDREGRPLHAVAYVLSTLLGGIGAAWIGLELAG